jgi:hypothetical protein
VHRTTWWRMRTNSPEIEERKSYYSSLRRLLTERVRGAFQEQHEQPGQHEQPDAKIAELVRQLGEHESARRR